MKFKEVINEADKKYAITDMGTRPSIKDDSGTTISELERYAVWGYISGKKGAQVIEISNDLPALLKKYKFI